MNGLKQEESHNRRQALMGQILQYLAAHPDAKDTADGILKWWLPSFPSESDKEQVQEALDALVTKGWLVKRVFPSSLKLYSINNEEKKEIKEFLQKISKRPDKIIGKR
jgi:hypothetical protein